MKPPSTYFRDLPPQPEDLVKAMKHGGSAVVAALLKAGAPVDEVGGGSLSTALMYAAYQNDISTAQLLVAHGADVHKKNCNGETALTHAAQSGSTDIVRLLLDAGADINVKGGDGFTPLIYTAALNKFKTAQLLVDRGANLDEQNYLGCTALQLARECGNEETAALLEAAPAERKKQAETAADQRARESAGPLKQAIPFKPPLRFPKPQ